MKDGQIRIQRIASGHSTEIHTPEQFIDAFSSTSPHDQDLLCELYQLNFLMQDNSRWKLNPFVRDIQLRALSSFVYNQTIWKEASTFYERAKASSSFLLRDEYPFPMFVQEEYYGFWPIPGLQQRYDRISAWLL